MIANTRWGTQIYISRNRHTYAQIQMRRNTIRTATPIIAQSSVQPPIPTNRSANKKTTAPIQRHSPYTHKARSPTQPAHTITKRRPIAKVSTHTLVALLSMLPACPSTLRVMDHVPKLHAGINSTWNYRVRDTVRQVRGQRTTVGRSK